MSSAIANRLEIHLQEKVANRSWLDQGHFPYRIASEGRASFEDHDYIPQRPSTMKPLRGEDCLPRYVVMIPQFCPAGSNLQELVARLMTLFANSAPGRIAVVVGANRHFSIDPSLNDELCSGITTLPKITSVACRVFGFLWKPEWERANHAVSKLYSKEKAFLILKALSPDRAKQIRLSLESSDNLKPQIPFTRIRERVKDFEKSRYFARHFFEQTPNAPVYFAVMDADCKGLRGLFSSFDALIPQHAYPSALTLGYRVEMDDRPLIELGVKIDMAVRAAMNSVIPYSAYFPEPFSLFRLRKPGHEGVSLKKFSFIGNGDTLENRRLIQNGRASKILQNDAFFGRGVGVGTTVPNRMLTLKNERVAELTHAVVKQKRCLESLRGIPQSHLMPLKWAENVYAALPFSTSHVSDAKAPFAHIFGVFDPITRMFANIGRYSGRVFDTIMDNYDAPLTNGQEATLKAARAALYLLGMKKQMVDQVVEAAKASGKAIYEVLSEATGRDV